MSKTDTKAGMRFKPERDPTRRAPEKRRIPDYSIKPGNEPGKAISEVEYLPGHLKACARAEKETGYDQTTLH